MPAKFVVFAQGRTGSTLLGDLLCCHPDVYFGGEVLDSRVRSTRFLTSAMRWRHARHTVGFHVKIYQLTETQGVSDVGGWLRAMHRRGWRVISLRRENLLRQVVSNLTAKAADRYEDRSRGTDFVRVRPHADPAELLHWMQVRSAAGAAEQAALDGIPHLALTYEADLQDAAVWPATMDRVFGHLDLEPVRVTTNLRRQNPGPVLALVSNYPEVRAALAGTEYARYLD